MILPQKLQPASKINLVNTSSPVAKSDLKAFNEVLAFLAKNFPATKLFDVEKTKLDPRYLAASESVRMRRFRQAIKELDWLLPIYGGTGCVDIIRRIDDDDLAKFRKHRPIVNGFSDTTFLINYLYFKLKLITFHYSNACGLLTSNNHKLFFDILTGDVNKFSFGSPNYKWLTEPAPLAPIEGIAIGGNLESFRELLDIGEIRPRSWQPYILFIEDIGIDAEDLHRIIAALDSKGIFNYIRALVVGRMDDKSFDSTYKRLNSIFEPKDIKIEHFIEYYLSEIIKERFEDGDPLHIIQVDNLGHGVTDNPMIIPIGAKTKIYPNKQIEFVGPFVESDEERENRLDKEKIEREAEEAKTTIQ